MEITDQSLVASIKAIDFRRSSLTNRLDQLPNGPPRDGALDEIKHLDQASAELKAEQRARLDRAS